MRDSRNSSILMGSMNDIFKRDSAHSMIVITDVLSGIDDSSQYTSLLPKNSSEQSPSHLPFLGVNTQIWLIITLISIVCAFYAFAVDFICIIILQARFSLTAEYHWALKVLIWLSFNLLFAIIAASCGKFISQDAEGSGIPEMKTIIGGAEIGKYLSNLTLTSKTVGLIAATGAGLSVGREGPFIHISCILASQISSHSFFARMMLPALRKQILALAVAVGVAATFGSPIGGLLFSIEVTATYYNVSNLWKSLYAASLCCFIFKFMGLDELTNLITSRHYADASIGFELIPFAIQGAIFGLFGSLIVFLAGKVSNLKKSYSDSLIVNRYVYTLSASLICSIIALSLDVMQTGDRKMISLMFKPESVKDGLGELPILQLLIYSICKPFMILLSISCPVPCGIFSPIFSLGAVLGRLYGETLYFLIKDTHPGVYALVGAACLSSSVTHTISVIVIVFELSGQISYLPFMLTGVLCSYAVTHSLTTSIYDLTMTLKKIPYMPSIKNIDIYTKTAKDIMNEAHSLHNVTSLRHIWNIVASNAKVLTAIPIVDKSGFIVGQAGLLDLIDYLHQEYEKVRPELIHRSSYDRYFEILYEMVKDEYFNIDIERSFEVLQYFSATLEFSEPALKKFWKTKVIIQFVIPMDTSPFMVNEDALLSKVHFLFVVLNLMQVYVMQRGVLIGVITRDSFLRANN